MDEGDVVDADKAEHLTQVGFLMIEAAARVDTAASSWVNWRETESCWRALLSMISTRDMG